MKNFFLILAILFPILCYSQNEISNCTLDTVQTNPIPNYLQSTWNSVKVGKFAVVYVDFPDGRYINGDDTLQPFYDYQLEWVNSHGEPDAAGEMGLINQPTNIPVGNKFMKASKYSWYDRWNMFFDSLGVYYGQAHPDWESHGDSAWGSLKQYWKEASNGKFDMIPYVTHPNETNYKLKTGIINGYEMVNGVPVIKCLKMPKKKYGLTNTVSYLRGHNNNENLTAAAEAMMNDAQNLIRTKTTFNLTQFLADDGVLFIYFAGSHGGLKDIGYASPRVSMVRLREGAITDPSSRIDGFGVTAHQYGHIQFRWNHTNSGRCDIMNGGDVHDNNSPQFPNPIYRMMQGWLQPIAMESTEQVQALQPIETSHKCGVVTIYGKPSAVGDWSTGESFIVENRRRLGFDRSLLDNNALSQTPNFKGGLLIWHYSPYHNYVTNPPDGTEPTVKFHSADNNTSLFQNRGNPTSFFAYLPFIPTQNYYRFDSSRTHSAINAKTGIEFKNIEQNDYNSFNSTIKFNLNYLISEPKIYDYVIYPKGGSVRKITLSNNVFYHSMDDKEYYNVMPGTKIDLAKSMTVNNMEAKGTEANNIIFRGPGYSNNFEGYFSNYNKGLLFQNNTSFLDVDTVILDNVKIQNTNTGVREIKCNSVNQVPVRLKNISVSPNFQDKTDYDVELTTNGNIIDLNLSNMQILSRLGNKFGELELNDSRITFYGNMFFNSVVNLFNSTLDNKYITVYPTFAFDKMPGNSSWEGINIEGGSVDLDKTPNAVTPVIKNAMTAINVANSTGDINISNIRFENNGAYDISLYKNSLTREDPVIKGNTFIMTDHRISKVASMVISECPNIIIDSNFIATPGYFGIVLMNNEMPLIRKNTIIGGDYSINSTGIISYNSNGYYKCNEISQFTNHGIELDNSQPILFNNNIFVNGLGIFLTNNSNPIMDPSFVADKTFTLGGYNWIHHNASEEIYCNNSKYYTSIPFMYKGYNAVEDVYHLSDVLIFNSEVSGVAPMIDCPDNYWGGSTPAGRLIPDYSFQYDQFLTNQLSYACDFILDNDDNSSMPEDLLLLGNLLKDQYEEDYSNSIGYSNQLLGLSNSNINPVIPLNNLFTSTLFSNGDFADLHDFYLSFASQYSSDTVLLNKSNNLAIKSKIEENQLAEAISDYDNIINNNINEEVRFYASIDKSRAIRLFLDSLLSSFGDNAPANSGIDKMYNEAINYTVNYDLKKKSKEETKNKTDNSKKESNFVAGQFSPQTLYPGLQKLVSDKVRDFNNLNINKKRSLIIEKNLLDLAVNNYVDGVASIKEKLQYLNQETTAAPGSYKLNQNYPNPFNPVTTISYFLPVDGMVKIKVYDITGKEVRTLESGFKTAGTYSLNFNGSNLASGIYYYKFESNGFVETKKMIMIK